ncbi:MAG: hypothetical protein WBQ23_08365 [Bacteroidota bacterium]
MTKRIASTLMLLAVIFSGGCQTSMQTTWNSELAAQQGNGPIRVLTTESVTYTFTDFTFNDSLLSGKGSIRIDDAASEFAGSIPFSRIVFIERLRDSEAKAIWVVPVAAITTVAIIALATQNGFSIQPHEGGSCPTVYAFDNTDFHLEAEAFGTSISKVMEATSYSVLTKLAPIDGRLVVRVANERPETHMINSVRLFAADAGDVPAAVLDIENNLWPLAHPLPPLSAIDASGRDVRHALEAAEGRMWISDLRNITPGSGFRDSIDLKFEMPQQTEEATLVVRAINTELITEVYRSVGGLLGDATMQFYQSLESDPALQQRIRNWLGDCSLTIEVEREDGWETVGTMLPEANMVSFSRAVRLRLPAQLQRPLRVRLSTLTDVWRIDAVLLDCSTVRPLPLRELPLLSVESSNGVDWEAAVAKPDSSYAILLPPDRIACEFDAAPAAQMLRPIYVFAARGYLYEWFPNDRDSPGAAFAANLSETQRVDMLKLLIQQKDIFLPPIYAQWRKSIGALQE